MIKSFSLNRLKLLSGSALKVIAVVAMLIDHTAHVLRSELDFMTEPLFAIGSTNITVYYIMRKIGRLAFPIFCFLIAEGFAHTRDPKKYAARILIFAIVSEIPFNLMASGSVFYSSKQNIYFTLFFGVLLMYIFKNVEGNLKKYILMTAVAAAALYLHTDYGLKGVLLILLIYVLREHPAAQAVLAFPLLSGGYAAFAAFLPINMYNGQRGFISSRIIQYLFYVFYPLHITVLVIIEGLLK